MLRHFLRTKVINSLNSFPGRLSSAQFSTKAVKEKEDVSTKKNQKIENPPNPEPAAKATKTEDLPISRQKPKGPSGEATRSTLMEPMEEEEELPTWTLDEWEESTEINSHFSGAREFPNIHPFQRAINILKRDCVIMKERAKAIVTGQPVRFDPDDYGYYTENIFPNHADIVIIGGGAMGSSIAYWLMERIRKDFRIVVIEKDPTYKTASTALSVGGIRQQFSFEENIEMSLFGSEFIRNVNKYLRIDGQDPIDLHFHPYGYLFLATEKGAETMLENHKLQLQLGAKNVILNPRQLKDRFPWMNTDGIAMGCLGTEKEGWFDPWRFLAALKSKATSLGVQYINAEALGFNFTVNSNFIEEGTSRAFHEKPRSVTVRTKDGKCRLINFSLCVIASGAFSGRVAKMARIGNGEGVLTIPLPVEPRKRYVYCIHAPDGPGLNTPMTVDPSGTYFRREGLGGMYICGKQPAPEEEPSTKDLLVDEHFFYSKIWPDLAHRVKAFNNVKLKASWAGHYEYNRYDQNGVVGVHPYLRNIVFATGFSGHGIQHCPAVGRAIMELVVHHRYMTLDLSRLSFDRFISLEPMRETVIV